LNWRGEGECGKLGKARGVHFVVGLLAGTGRIGLRAAGSGSTLVAARANG
jgi:hypothetical protein